LWLRKVRTAQARHWRICVSVFEGMLGQIGEIADRMSFAACWHWLTCQF
jgi:hypothetical protein